MPSSSLRGASHESTSRNMDHGQVGRPVVIGMYYSESEITLLYIVLSQFMKVMYTTNQLVVMTT